MVRPIEVAGGWVPATCSGPDLALIFGISRRAVTDLISSGVVVKSPQKGRYLTLPSIQNYLEKLRKNAAGRSDELNLTSERAKRESIEMERAKIRLDRERGELLSLDEVISGWTSFAKAIKSAILSLPGRARSTIPHLTAHDGETLKLLCRDTLDLIADEIEAGVVGIGDNAGLGKD